VQVIPALIKHTGWDVRQVDADRNALCQSDPGERGIDRREKLRTILVVLVRDASRHRAKAIVDHRN
jgi:hypothetical protein